MLIDAIFLKIVVLGSRYVLKEHSSKSHCVRNCLSTVSAVLLGYTNREKTITSLLVLGERVVKSVVVIVISRIEMYSSSESQREPFGVRKLDPLQSTIVEPVKERN